MCWVHSVLGYRHGLFWGAYCTADMMCFGVHSVLGCRGRICPMHPVLGCRCDVFWVHTEYWDADEVYVGYLLCTGMQLWCVLYAHCAGRQT